MRKDHRLALSAACADFALYLVMLSLPYRVMEAGASSLVLGLVPVLYAAPYSVIALNAGRFSDRWPRRVPIRVGLGLAVIAALILSEAQQLKFVLAAIPLIGIGLGFYWPSAQAGMSEVHGGRELHRLTRLTNMGWSTGKGLGLVLGGLLFARIGAPGLSLIAGGAWLTSALIVPWMQRPADHAEVIASDESRPNPTRQRAFLWSAWLANSITFGVAATLNHHLPKILSGAGTGADGFGLFFGLVFLSQTALFFFVGPRKGWHYKVLPLLGVQVMIAIAVLAAPRADSLVKLLLLAPVFGMGLGFAYQSSLYYSLHASSGRGKQAGIHEASLGIASASIPLLGGYLVRYQGSEVPFTIAAVAVTSSLLLSTFWLYRSRSKRL